MALLSGMRVLISAGPTWEMIDPVRFLSNRSSGALGYALARVAQQRGAIVTLVSGPTALRPPARVRTIAVRSALDMHRACVREAKRADLIIMAAAVADYRPVRMRRHKLKKDTIAAPQWSLELVRNPDILADLCRRRRGTQRIVGFALESKDLLRQARAKLQRKGCDLIVANAVPAIGAARHRATLIDRSGRMQRFPALPKAQLARQLLRAIAAYGASDIHT